MAVSFVVRVWQLTERECQLDIALLRCGKLHEGLELFREWLDDIETRQLQQQPYSIDPKALRPQQQMQEVLIKALLWLPLIQIQL